MRYIKVIVCTIALILLCGCVSEKPGTENSDVNSQIIPEKTPVIYTGTPVNTPCGEIYLPEEWASEVDFTIETDKDTKIRFTSDGIPLYTLIFSSIADNSIGVCSTDAGVVYVGMEMYEIQDNTDDMMSNQESVNVLLEQLDLQPLSGEPNREETYFEVETQYGVIDFPQRWEKMLTVENTGNGTDFYGNIAGKDRVLLFSITDEKSDSAFRAILKDKDKKEPTVYITIPEIQFDGNWTETDKNMIYGMQEDVNYIIARNVD